MFSKLRVIKPYCVLLAVTGEVLICLVYHMHHTCFICMLVIQIITNYDKM
ncbi:hypothetical protein Hanom_Chr07g00594011 [Helianthus anomalus]